MLGATATVGTLPAIFAKTGGTVFLFERGAQTLLQIEQVRFNSLKIGLHGDLDFTTA
jgi:hypothetical protein